MPFPRRIGCSPTNPLDVWEFASQWGDHPQEDLQQAIATCVVEHLLGYHFEQVFPLVEERALNDPNFTRMVSGCREFGQTQLSENSRKFDALIASARRGPAT